VPLGTDGTQLRKRYGFWAAPSRAVALCGRLWAIGWRSRLAAGKVILAILASGRLSR
jgi:hypothetical protein